MVSVLTCREDFLCVLDEHAMCSLLLIVCKDADYLLAVVRQADLGPASALTGIFTHTLQGCIDVCLFAHVHVH